MGDMSDRRRFPRYPCTGAAEIFQSGQLWGWATVSDLSRCGCYLETLAPLPLGAEVGLRLAVAGTILDINAKVVCATPLVGIGMEFLAASQEQENLIAQFIADVTGTNRSASASGDLPDTTH
jgi:hypothetical protein